MHPPGRIAFVASGLVVDAVIWCALVQTPFTDLRGVAIVPLAASLCWSRLLVMPRLVWLPRRLGWKDATWLLAGSLLVAVATLFATAIGLVVGFLTFILLTIPGFLAAGAFLPASVALVVNRVFPPVPVTVSVKRAVASGMSSVLVLGAGLLAADSDWGGLLALQAAGVVASAVGRPSPGAAPRALLVAAALSVAVPAGLLLLAARHAPFPAPVGADFGCPGAIGPDCLADRAYALGLAEPAPSWLSTKRHFALDDLAVNLGRAGHTAQAVAIAGRLRGPDRDRALLEAEAGRLAGLARASPAAIGLGAGEVPGPHTARLLAAVADDLTGRAPLPAPMAAAASLPHIADRLAASVPTAPAADRPALAASLTRLRLQMGQPVPDEQWGPSNPTFDLLSATRRGAGAVAAIASPTILALQRRMAAGTVPPPLPAQVADALLQRMAIEDRFTASLDAADVRALAVVLRAVSQPDAARAVADRLVVAAGTDPRLMGIAAAALDDDGREDAARALVTQALAHVRPASPTCPPLCAVVSRDLVPLAAELFRLGEAVPLPTPDQSDSYRPFMTDVAEWPGPHLPLATVAKLADTNTLFSAQQTVMNRLAAGDRDGASTLLEGIMRRPDVAAYHGDTRTVELALALGRPDLATAALRAGLHALPSDDGTAVSALAAFWRNYGVPPG